MVRTQIQLTEEQFQTLKEMAARPGVSMSELIRRSVEHMIEQNEEEEKWRRALSVMGRFRSGLSDVSTNHDKHLAEGYSERPYSSTLRHFMQPSMSITATIR